MHHCKISLGKAANNTDRERIALLMSHYVLVNDVSLTCCYWEMPFGHVNKDTSCFFPKKMLELLRHFRVTIVAVQKQ